MSDRSDIHQDRLAAVRQALSAWQVEGVLIHHAAHRRWLSGFTGSAGQILVTAKQAMLATDSRYWEQAAEQAPAFSLFKHRRHPEDDAAFISRGQVISIGLEAAHVSLAQAAVLENIPDISWVPLEQTLEPMRSLKTAQELDTMRAAAAITDKAMAQVPHLASPGMSEKALAWQLEKSMREDGADALAFDIIVAAGPNSARPHHNSGDRPLQIGDAIIIDMGAELDGYKSDLTRTFYLGDEPSAQFWKVYQAVLAAHTAVFAQAAAGMNARQVDGLARQLITEQGYEEHFGHSLGHNIGLEIHERPILSARPEAEKDIVAVNMAITIEPGIYLPGWGGVRIEDLAYFTEAGLEPLSHCPKTPIIPIR